MSESSGVMDRACAEVTRLCYAGLGGEELLREVAERTRRVVPLEGYCLTVNDPSSGLITGAVLSDPACQEAARDAMVRITFEDEVTPFLWMAKRRLAARSLSETTGGKPERALRYRELM